MQKHAVNQTCTKADLTTKLSCQNLHYVKCLHKIYINYLLLPRVSSKQLPMTPFLLKTLKTNTQKLLGCVYTSDRSPMNNNSDTDKRFASLCNQLIGV